MKKIIFTALITWTLITTNAIAEKIDCTKFDKVSTKYLGCSAKNLKEKITTNAKNSKTKFNKLNLKEKLVKFKNSKTLTKFMEK